MNQSVEKIGIWTLVSVLLLKCIQECTKVGAYWDSKEDLHLARENWAQLYSGSVEPFTPQMLYLQQSYSWTTLYMAMAPIKILGFLGIDIDPDRSTGIIYRNFFTLLIFCVGAISIAIWCRNYHKVPFNLSLLLVLATPTLVGHGMMNEKDIPPFAGVACTLALFSVVHTQEQKNVNRQSIFALSFLSTLFVGGSRPGLLLLTLPVLFLTLYLVAKNHHKQVNATIITAQFLGFIFLWFTSYAFQKNGIFWIFNSLTSSSAFGNWGGRMIVWDHIFYPGKSRFYFISVLSSQIPEWAIFALVITFAFWLKRLTFRNSHLRRHILNFSQLKFLPVYIFMTVVVYSIFFTPVLYNDARQFLFIWALILPIVIPLLHMAITGRAKTVKVLAIGLIGFSLIQSVSLGEYKYIYRNAFAVPFGTTAFENDYWALSSKSLVGLTMENPIVTGIAEYQAGPVNPVSSFLPEDFELSDNNNFLYFDLDNSVMQPNRYPNCPKAVRISAKQLFFKEIVLSYSSVCQVEHEN